MNSLIIAGVVLLFMSVAAIAYSAYLCWRDVAKRLEQIEQREAEHPAVRASREVH